MKDSEVVENNALSWLQLCRNAHVLPITKEVVLRNDGMDCFQQPIM